jgi:AcrR family transcriptional regulator
LARKAPSSLGAARAPFGSLYHHFPGGKQQLGSEVVRAPGAMYATLIPAAHESHDDLVAGVREFFRLAGEHLEQSGWQDACPIATIALEVACTSEPLREATGAVFESWVGDGERVIAAHGIDPPLARRLAIGLLGALEGAFVLARAWRSVEPLHAAGEAVAADVERALRSGLAG